MFTRLDCAKKLSARTHLSLFEVQHAPDEGEGRNEGLKGGEGWVGFPTSGKSPRGTPCVVGGVNRDRSGGGEGQLPSLIERAPQRAQGVVKVLWTSRGLSEAETPDHIAIATRCSQYDFLLAAVKWGDLNEAFLTLLMRSSRLMWKVSGVTPPWALKTMGTMFMLVEMQRSRHFLILALSAA